MMDPKSFDAALEKPAQPIIDAITRAVEKTDPEEAKAAIARFVVQYTEWAWDVFKSDLQESDDTRWRTILAISLFVALHFEEKLSGTGAGGSE